MRTETKKRLLALAISAAEMFVLCGIIYVAAELAYSVIKTSGTGAYLAVCAAGLVYMAVTYKNISSQMELKGLWLWLIKSLAPALITAAGLVLFAAMADDKGLRVVFLLFVCAPVWAFAVLSALCEGYAAIRKT